MSIKSIFLSLLLSFLCGSAIPVAGQTFNCPLMQVRLSALPLKACETAVYTVQYCNAGNANATPARLTVTLPAGLVYQSSIPAPQSVFGRVLNYNLGTVAPGVCGQIVFRVQVPCNTPAGQTFCLKADISPNICLPATQGWSGATLTVAGNCYGNGDSLRFTVYNRGTAVAPAAEYIIIEDHLIFRTGPIGPINTADSAGVTLYNVNGKTYTFQMPQVANHPVRRDLSLSVEACGGTATPGILLQYPQYNGNPFSEMYCAAVEDVANTNAKQAWPQGYQQQHYIEANTMLQYQLRFVNSATTTLQRVVVTDSLPAGLDLNTLQTGPSSHPYTSGLQGRVLNFTLDNLNLPPGGSGYVTVFIQPEAGLPLPWPLHNRAQLAFSNSPSVQTNTVMHTIGLKFLKTETTQWLRQGIHLSIAPNPASTYVLIQVKGAVDIRHWRLLGANGSQVARGDVQEQEWQMDVSGLPRGIYFLQLLSANGRVAGGRLVVE